MLKRKIEFAARPIKKDLLWVFGSLLEEENRVFIVDKEGVEYQVDPNTICQLVADLDEQLFYEGDILTDDESTYWVITYREDLGAFVLENEMDDTDWIGFDCVVEDIFDWDCVGNIHDSSESGDLYFFDEFFHIRKKDGQIIVEGTVSKKGSSPINLTVAFECEEDFYDALKDGIEVFG